MTHSSDFSRETADHGGDGALVGIDADNIGAALDFAIEALDGVGAVDLGAVLAREVHVGEHVMLGGIHQLGQLRHSRAELVGHSAPLGMGGGRIGLGGGSADPGGDQAALHFASMRRRIAHEVEAGAVEKGLVS